MAPEPNAFAPSTAKPVIFCVAPSSSSCAVNNPWEGSNRYRIPAMWEQPARPNRTRLTSIEAAERRWGQVLELACPLTPHSVVFYESPPTDARAFINWITLSIAVGWIDMLPRNGRSNTNTNAISSARPAPSPANE
jgi:hypothetical protein